jgi:hypothetical protein
MHLPWKSVGLDSLGVLRARGADAHRFLQGQLSNDMARLTPERTLLSGYHNPQGRAIALLRLLEVSADDVLAVLPRELLADVAGRLGKFILRAKVKLSDESAQWRIDGLIAGGEQVVPYAGVLPPPGGVGRTAAALIARLAPSRLLVLQPGGPAALPPLPGAGLTDWQRVAIADGEPQVYAATSEEFVAQMLNLDALDAIAFEKGCYTGQEVIARAHYRGRVKRRMQRFLSRGPARLQPGDAGVLGDGRSFKVVQAAQHADGRAEFLAVCAQRAPGGEPHDEAPPGTASPTLEAEQLGLPYALPD